MTTHEVYATWLQGRIRTGIRQNLLKAGGYLLAALPVFVVTYAFTFATLIYFFYMSTVRLGLNGDGWIDQVLVVVHKAARSGFGPDLWAFGLLAVLIGAYAKFLRLRQPPLEVLPAVDDLTPVLVVPAMLRGDEHTSLRRASPTIGGYLFTIVFALPMLLESVWRALVEAWRLSRMDVPVCARVLEVLGENDGPLEMKTLAEHVEETELLHALPRLWQLHEVRFTGDDPQTVTLAELAKDDAFILSVA